MRRHNERRVPYWVTTALVIGAFVLLGMVMGQLGLGRATQADVRAVETRVAERCR